jgi:glutathione S-transferase
MIELYQAEWCPFSSLVRERLTEVGEPFVARQVPVRHPERTELLRVTGSDEIPALVLDDGTTISGTERIIAHIDAHYENRPDASLHRSQYEREGPGAR